MDRIILLPLHGAAYWPEEWCKQGIVVIRRSTEERQKQEEEQPFPQQKPIIMPDDIKLNPNE